MNLTEIDRLIAQREQRIEKNKADGKIPFEKDKLDPLQERKQEAQGLIRRMKDLEVLAFDGITDEIQAEADKINRRLIVLEEECKAIIAERENGKEED